MAKKIKTKEELQANIDKAEKEIRQGENYIKQLLQENHQQERKLRTRRLIERGAIAESLIADSGNITNEQFKTLLSSALSTPAVREMLIVFLNESTTITPKNPQD